VGLVQREIEAAGIATVILSNIPDLTASVSPPRIAAIENPCGRTLGLPGDVEGQRAVLRAMLSALREIDAPGGIRHLPYRWPDEVPNREEMDPPPIAEYLKRHPWDLRRLLNRDVPEKYRV
jgi:hypothetical protein